MPRGYRCVILAAFGWLSLAAAPTPNSGAGADQRNTAGEVSNSLGTIASALKEANEPKRESADCAEGRDDRKSDLCAQWKAADAAESSASATWQTVYLTAIGLALGAVTMAAAIAAAWFAKRAADAAEKTLNHAVETSNVEMRPYISTNVAKVKSTPYEGKWTVRIKFRNTGSAPARNVKVYLIAWLDTFPISKQRLEKDKELLLFGDIPVGSDKYCSATTPLRLTPEQVRDIQTGRSVARFYIKIDYEFDREPKADIVEREGVICGPDAWKRGEFRLITGMHRRGLEIKPELEPVAPSGEGTANDGDGHPAEG